MSMTTDEAVADAQRHYDGPTHCNATGDEASDYARCELELVAGECPEHGPVIGGGRRLGTDTRETADEAFHGWLEVWRHETKLGRAPKETSLRDAWAAGRAYGRTAERDTMAQEACAMAQIVEMGKGSMLHAVSDGSWTMSAPDGTLGCAGTAGALYGKNLDALAAVDAVYGMWVAAGRPAYPTMEERAASEFGVIPADHDEDDSSDEPPSLTFDGESARHAWFDYCDNPPPDDYMKSGLSFYAGWDACLVYRKRKARTVIARIERMHAAGIQRLQKIANEAEAKGEELENGEHGTKALREELDCTDMLLDQAKADMRKIRQMIRGRCEHGNDCARCLIADASGEHNDRISAELERDNLKTQLERVTAAARALVDKSPDGDPVHVDFDAFHALDSILAEVTPTEET